jgi:fibronectin type 3 domain-containing protein
MAKKTIFTLTAIILVLAIHCGKKGPLKLEPEILPKKVENFKASQVGSSIRLQWDFPKIMADKKKTELFPENVTKIEVYYSTKNILGGKFRKKSDLIKKLTMKNLTRYVDPFQKKRMEELTSIERKKKERFTYYTDIHFETKNLTGKTHFFAIRYLYGRKKSPLSQVTVLSTQTPVKAISDLKVTRENKLIKLDWSKPKEDILGMPVPNIAGYIVFRKTIPKTTEETEPQEYIFEKINRNNVLTEYYEDKDTGQDGEYHYYVSTVISGTIESAPSSTVSVSVTDVYPPDIPANLVCFKASDHIFLTWKPVADDDLSHYRIYRKSEKENEYKLVEDNVTTPQYKDKDVQKGVLYNYTITSVDVRGNESDHSNSVKEEF